MSTQPKKSNDFLGPIRDISYTRVITGISQLHVKSGIKSEDLRKAGRGEFHDLISSGAVKPVRLTCGATAIVDHSDADMVSQFSWSMTRSGRNRYAVNSRKDRKPQTVSMHRLILDLVYAGRSVVVDHINGNGLDNRRCNLRVCTQDQNLANQRKRGKRSRFKGVSPVSSGRWAAKITAAGKLQHIGTFETEEEAARAYDDAARDLHGDYAALNLPRGAA